jgi:UDP-2-acetamido-2,6-beta-L-arabino-hexul-4-ose reductase
MTRVLVTGAKGFLGRNLTARLTALGGVESRGADIDTPLAELHAALEWCDVIFHLAGANRPTDPDDFQKINRDFTKELCSVLTSLKRTTKIVFSSSIQAALDNSYGVSKREAEEVLLQFRVNTGASIRIYRLKNVFGKWCRPNYNSVTATFCYNIANDLPLSVSDPSRELELSYVDDVVEAFLSEIEGQRTEDETGADIKSYRIRLGDLAGKIQAFHDMRAKLTLPDFADWFNCALYATYLSYIPPEELRQSLDIKSDDRGSLAEIIKQEHFGQIFVSRTKPGITRGNHYHHTKTEKFFVVEGDGLIRMRAVQGGHVEEYSVTGSEYQVIDIPPGFTHSITNVGAGEMVTLFWSSEMFDPNYPDTYYLPVDSEEPNKSMLPENV